MPLSSSFYFVRCWFVALVLSSRFFFSRFDHRCTYPLITLHPLSVFAHCHLVPESIPNDIHFIQFPSSQNPKPTILKKHDPPSDDFVVGEAYEKRGARSMESTRSMLYVAGQWKGQTGVMTVDKEKRRAVAN
ncbi:hypothetical protein E1B28_002723 [Marasmius oreades]|uniref:Uncharacterized protein n=1 Tax=Marasmius oreades TaxID=181124 RepID=A0A9P7UM86_9AGAR|nr:uncharacterized protein E1B28_002723 [Marasmius oreades]KAG7086795.1 hypothetical protein E1B28_002723 [Marasmius oreades]